MANLISAVRCRRVGRTWVIDDPFHGLEGEALVAGASEAVDAMLGPAAAETEEFTLLFSDRPFPGFQATGEWSREGHDGFGDWYLATIGGQSIEAWLCPALRLYFPEAAPRRLYAAAGA